MTFDSVEHPLYTHGWEGGGGYEVRDCERMAGEVEGDGLNIVVWESRCVLGLL